MDLFLCLVSRRSKSVKAMRNSYATKQPREPFRIPRREVKIGHDVHQNERGRLLNKNGHGLQNGVSGHSPLLNGKGQAAKTGTSHVTSSDSEGEASKSNVRGRGDQVINVDVDVEVSVDLTADGQRVESTAVHKDDHLDERRSERSKSVQKDPPTTTTDQNIAKGPGQRKTVAGIQRRYSTFLIT